MLGRIGVLGVTGFYLISSTTFRLDQKKVLKFVVLVMKKSSYFISFYVIFSTSIIFFIGSGMGSFAHKYVFLTSLMQDYRVV